MDAAAAPGAFPRAGSRRSLLYVAVWWLVLGVPLPWPWRPAARSHRRWRLVAVLLVAVTAAALRDVAPSDVAALRQLFVAVRTAPATAAAVVWGLVHGGALRFRDGMIVIGRLSAGYGPRSGITVGQVFLTDRPPGTLSEAVLRHEARHRDQWAVLGPVTFPIAYGVAEVTATWILHAGKSGNVFEMAAGLHDGGYGPPHGRAAKLLLRVVDDVVPGHGKAPAGPAEPGPATQLVVAAGDDEQRTTRASRV